MRIGRYRIGRIDAILAVLLPATAIGLYVEFSDSVTPLDVIEAARSGDIKLIAEHLGGGFDFLAQDERGRTVLHAATESGEEGLVRLVLFRGGIVAMDAYDTHGYTPAHLSLGIRTPYGPGTTPTLSAFLDYGVDVNLKTRFGQSLIVTAMKSQNETITLALLEEGATIDDDYVGGLPTIAYVADASMWNLLERLLEDGATASLDSDSSSVSPLASAIQEQNPYAVQLLLRHGADPNALFSVRWSRRPTTGDIPDATLTGPKPIGYEQLSSDRYGLLSPFVHEVYIQDDDATGFSIRRNTKRDDSFLKDWIPRIPRAIVPNIAPSTIRIAPVGSGSQDYHSLICPLDFALWHDRACARVLLEHGAMGDGFMRFLVDAINR